MNISIIGTGYVGLVTGACFAETGNIVTCMDVSEERINNLSKGILPFYEPGLMEIIERNINNKRLRFTSSYEDACLNNIHFICVGTPDSGDGSPDLTAIKSVIESLKQEINSNSFIYTKSTVPLGTNPMMQDFFDTNLDKTLKVIVSSNPEFLKEGSAVNDFQKPDRIIVGTNNEDSMNVMKELYEPFNRVKNKLHFMSVESAELTKYASNSFLATKISFMNEMALISEKTGANINEVRLGMGSDPRIGEAFLYAGLGYGGSCFPKDINALIATQEKLKIKDGILKRTQEVNERQVEIFSQKILDNLSNPLNENILTIWGLSFKPNSDDIRESVSLKLIRRLSDYVDKLNLYDPLANDSAKQELSDIKNISFFEEKYKALENSNALVICTEWKEFWDPDFEYINKMKSKVIFDGRNILNKTRLENEGIKYFGIGL